MVKTVCVTAIRQSASTCTTKCSARPASAESAAAIEKTARPEDSPAPSGRQGVADAQGLTERNAVEGHEGIHEGKPHEQDRARYHEGNEPREHGDTDYEARQEEARPEDDGPPHGREVAGGLALLDGQEGGEGGGDHQRS